MILTSNVDQQLAFMMEKANPKWGSRSNRIYYNVQAVGINPASWENTTYNVKTYTSNEYRQTYGYVTRKG